MTSTLPPLVQAVSGAVGSAAANAASYPLDLVCTRLQLADDSQKQGLQAPIDILRNIIKSQGISGLYDGLETDTAATLVSNFFYFYAYSALRSLAGRNRNKLLKTPGPASAAISAVEEICIGFIAGVASRAVSTPLGLITVRLQEERRGTDAPGRLESIKRIIKRIYSENGLRGFWRGFRTTALLCLNPSLTFTFFQAFRSLMLRGRDRANPTPHEAFLGAAFSNVLAVALLYPLILAKTRLQSAKSHVSRYPSSMLDVWKDAHARSGFRGFYQGLEAQLFKGFLNQGLTMMIKQRIEQFIIGFYLHQSRKSGNRLPLLLIIRRLSSLDDYGLPTLSSLTIRIRALSESDAQL